jgi:hypothetical protein
MTRREELSKAQTGSRVGHFHQGEPHPELPHLWFWRYNPNGREYWVTAEHFDKLREGVRRSVKRHNPKTNIELLEKTCPECGTIFHTRHTRVLCCSSDCTMERMERSDNQRRRRFTSHLAMGLGEFGEDEA